MKYITYAVNAHIEVAIVCHFFHKIGYLKNICTYFSRILVC